MKKVQEDTVSVVQLVTDFSRGKIDMPALLAALEKRQALAEDEYRNGMDTLWRLREEQAIDEISVTTLLDRMRSMRSGTDVLGSDDATVFQPARPAAAEYSDTTHFVTAQDSQPCDDASRTGTQSSQLPSVGNWSTLAVSEERFVSVGSTLKGRFHLERELGRGGMGVVYLAQDARKIEARDRDPWVAVKVLSDEFRRHPDSLVALQREARRSQKLAHDNIVRVHDFDKDEGIVYMTMEYVDGRDLRTWIREMAPDGLPLKQARPMIEGMANALGRAHAAGIVHSDFKPGNVMVTADNVPKVFDFGIARAGKHKGDAAGEQTVFDPSTLGAMTPAYASLEMLRGHAPSIKDDIYALGCVCFELLTGRHPYDKLSAEIALKERRQVPTVRGLTRRQFLTLSSAVALEEAQRLPDVQSLVEGLRDVGWKERTLPVVGYGAVGIVLLCAAGFGLWRKNATDRLDSVRTGFTVTSPERYRDEAEAQSGLNTLSSGQQGKLVVEQNDLIQSFLLTRLDELWNPDAGRFGYAATRAVFALRERLRLYAPQLDTRREQLEVERDVELNRLDTRLLSQLGSGDPFAEGKDSVQQMLGYIRQIDPASPLLKHPDLELAYATSIAAAIQAGRMVEAQEHLATALDDFPDSLRLELQLADWRQRAEPVAAVALDGGIETVRARFNELLAAPSVAPEWQSTMAAVMARLAQEADGLGALQQQFSERIADYLGTRHAPDELPDDLVLLDFALDTAPATAALLAQQARLEKRHGEAMASLEASRAEADIASKRDSLKRAVAATDVEKAEALHAQLRKSHPDAAFVRDEAPVLLEQAHLARAKALLAKGDFAAASTGLKRAASLLPERAQLQQISRRYETVARVMAVTSVSSAEERLQASQLLEERYREDAAGMSALERQLQASGQLPGGSLRGHLQKGAAEPSAPAASSAAATRPTGTVAEKTRSGTTPRTAQVPAAPLPGAVSEDEPLPPVPDGPDPCDGSVGRGRTCHDVLGNDRGPMLIAVPGIAGGKPFALSRGEIAVDDFNVYCRATGKCTVRGVASAELGRLPAQNITLAQARHYARWLTRASGGWRYRLPTDAEWLHAAQAGQQWQRAPDANCIPPTASAGHEGGAVGVRGREANPWGLVNMAGNVWEWVATGGESGALRGGSYTSFWSDCTVQSQRSGSGGAQADVGFRVLREIK